MPKIHTGVYWLLLFLSSVSLLACSSQIGFLDTGAEGANDEITPFTNVAATALSDNFQIWNYRPGVAIFDYDRDGDQDFYITSEVGYGNFLYQNQGDGSFLNVAETAGVVAVEASSSGVVACDLNNDGYQDLYVGGRGIEGDRLDFRSALGDGSETETHEQAIKDRLFLNNSNGTFADITDEAFGDSVNLRSAASPICADVDNDGWLDIYVANLIDEDYFFTSSVSSHPGHYNVLYRNNGDMTFTEIAESAGVQGEQIWMRDPQGIPITFHDEQTGQTYEGYDPTEIDANGNRVGDPSAPSHAAVFFDFDDDGDQDLWVANDGDRFNVYENISTPGKVRFEAVGRTLGVDKVGNWMGLALGDYDGDADLDIFVTNAGFHPRLGPPKESPSSDCKYHERFAWGTCLHFLLKNEAMTEPPRTGWVGTYSDVAPSTMVEASAIMPPASLTPDNIDPAWSVPTGLSAYDFGYGATFFDYDNDANVDLYWLGSEIARGDGPGGNVYPAAGRMMRGDGQGHFQDITVETRLLDVLGVQYDRADFNDPNFNPRSVKISGDFHENGKGVAHGDLNGDGYVDLIATNSSGLVWTGSIGDIENAPAPLFVWMNGGGNNNWITLRLQGRMGIDGTGSNADGIGARVYLTTLEPDGEVRRQVQEVRAGSSYLSMDSVDLEFGLGSASRVREISIHWPSGTKQNIVNVPANQNLLITETEN